MDEKKRKQTKDAFSFDNGGLLQLPLLFFLPERQNKKGESMEFPFDKMPENGIL